MEGLLPYIYKAIVQHKEIAGRRNHDPLTSTGDSARFSWDSAYVRLPGDSPRCSSDIHDLSTEAVPSRHGIYKYEPPHFLSNNINIRVLPAPAAAGHHAKI